MGTGVILPGVKPSDGLASPPGGSSSTPRYVSCSGNLDRLRPLGPLARVRLYPFFYKSKLTSTSRFSLKGIFRFWARVLTPFCPGVISWLFAVSTTVSTVLQAASSLLFWFHSPGSVSELAQQAVVLVSVLIHGELMTVSLLCVRVFGLLSGVPLPSSFLALVL